MVNTLISQLGSTICVSDMEEERVPALGNGDSLPGEMVTILYNTGKVDNSDAGAVELNIGILDKVHDKDVDTAPADAQPCSVIIPKSGHRYRIRITDCQASKYIGQNFEFSDTEGELKYSATLDDKPVAKLAKGVVSGDTVAEFWWL